MHEARSQILLETRRYQVGTSCSCVAKMHWRRWSSEYLPPPPRPCRLQHLRSVPCQSAPLPSQPQRVPCFRGSPGQNPETWPSCDRPETLLAMGLLHSVFSLKVPKMPRLPAKTLRPEPETWPSCDRPETLLAVGLLHSFSESAKNATPASQNAEAGERDSAREQRVGGYNQVVTCGPSSAILSAASLQLC